MEILEAGSARIEYSDNGHSRTIIMFPGFPGPAIRSLSDEVTVKTTIQQAAFANDYNFAYTYYTGVGPSAGQFTFYQTIADGREVAQHFEAQNHELLFIGHSWGAVVTAGVFAAGAGQKIAVLITPYLYLPEKDAAATIVSSILKEYPDLDMRIRLDEALARFDEIRPEADPLAFIEENSGHIRAVFLAPQDEVVDHTSAQPLLLKHHIPLLPLSGGHAFDIDEKFAEKIAQILAETTR